MASGNALSSSARRRLRKKRSKPAEAEEVPPIFFSQELSVIRMVDNVQDDNFGNDIFDCIIGYRLLRYRIDVFEKWPSGILQLFRHSNLNFCDRMRLILFTIINELDVTTLIKVLELLGPMKRNPAARVIIRRLYWYFIANPGSAEENISFRVKTRTFETVFEAMKRRPHMAMVFPARKAAGASYPDRLGVIPEIGVDRPPKPTVPTISIEEVENLTPRATARFGQSKVKEVLGGKTLEETIRCRVTTVLRCISDNDITRMALKYVQAKMGNMGNDANAEKKTPKNDQ